MQPNYAALKAAMATGGAYAGMTDAAVLTAVNAAAVAQAVDIPISAVIQALALSGLLPTVKGWASAPPAVAGSVTQAASTAAATFGLIVGPPPLLASLPMSATIGTVSSGVLTMSAITSEAAAATGTGASAPARPVRLLWPRAPWALPGLTSTSRPSTSRPVRPSACPASPSPRTGPDMARCQHPGCELAARPRGRGREPIYCAEHASLQWQSWRVRQWRAERPGRTEAEIRADLAAQLGEILGKWHRVFQNDRREAA